MTASRDPRRWRYRIIDLLASRDEVVLFQTDVPANLDSYRAAHYRPGQDEWMVQADRGDGHWRELRGYELRQILTWIAEREAATETKNTEFAETSSRPAPEIPPATTPRRVS